MKAITTILALSISVALVACQKKETPETESSSATPASSTTPADSTAAEEVTYIATMSGVT